MWGRVGSSTSFNPSSLDEWTVDTTVAELPALCLLQLTCNDCQFRAYLCMESHWSKKRSLFVVKLSSSRHSWLNSKFYLLDGFESEIVCFKLIGETGSLGIKLLRHVPNSGRKLWVKVHRGMVLCTQNRGNKTKYHLQQWDWPFPNQIPPSE